MIRLFNGITSIAGRIDGWLQDRLGQPYRIMLNIGLTADIVHRISDAPSHVAQRPHLAGTILAVAMELAILLHQLAEMNERLGHPHRSTRKKDPTDTTGG